MAGVATFCRVKSATSSCEAALPVAAEEGFTGLVNGGGKKNDTSCVIAQGLEEYDKEELLRIDQEGRCVITDHSHFGIFITHCLLPLTGNGMLLLLFVNCVCFY